MYNKQDGVNYKTGIKDLHFKMQADNKAATISIVMAQGDAERRTIFFNQFIQLKKLLQHVLQEEWQWTLHVPNENNKTVSCIYTSLDNVSIFKKEDWPGIVSLFKPRIIALDAFWNEVKYGFE